MLGCTSRPWAYIGVILDRASISTSTSKEGSWENLSEKWSLTPRYRFSTPPTEISLIFKELIWFLFLFHKVKACKNFVLRSFCQNLFILAFCLQIKSFMYSREHARLWYVLIQSHLGPFVLQFIVDHELSTQPLWFSSLNQENVIYSIKQSASWEPLVWHAKEFPTDFSIYTNKIQKPCMWVPSIITPKGLGTQSTASTSFRKIGLWSEKLHFRLTIFISGKVSIQTPSHNPY